MQDEGDFPLQRKMFVWAGALWHDDGDDAVAYLLL